VVGRTQDVLLRDNLAIILPRARYGEGFRIVFAVINLESLRDFFAVCLSFRHHFQFTVIRLRSALPVCHLLGTITEGRPPIARQVKACLWYRSRKSIAPATGWKKTAVLGACTTRLKHPAAQAQSHRQSCRTHGKLQTSRSLSSPQICSQLALATNERTFYHA
jgi:hypothetical protein